MVATRAPVAIVFRRGPTDWWMLGRWDLVTGDFEAGAWLRGRLYPRRSDLSPDGTLLYAFIDRKVTRPYERLRGGPYHAVSKVPWFFALAAWSECCGTWTRGFHFVEERGSARTWQIGEPDAGDAAPVRARYGLAATPVVQYAAERRRGWIDDELSPPRDPEGDPWDERRSAVLTKPRPRGGGRLLLEDRGHDFRGRIEGRRPLYTFEHGERSIVLRDATWADWDALGRLLVGTGSGHLELRDADEPTLPVLVDHDLSSLQPAPQPAPAWATRW